ncbi:hypothetical protein [Streptomyces boninensis]|uniref:hypothetical protein n=1 Tax=Streptomyces boninensis TaxID=2039455 RepID=UPI003B213979
MAGDRIGRRERLRRWWRRKPPYIKKRLVALAAALGAGLLALAGWGISNLLEDEPRCAAGLSWDAETSECYGVTAGADDKPFIEELQPVMRQVEELNQAVEDDGRSYVTIALMIPMVPAEDDPNLTPRQVLREVQGAYLAVRNANDLQEKGADKPRTGSKTLIRLALANPGREMAHWEDVSNDLDKWEGDKKHNLRAVFGFNLSVKRTEETIDYLTNDKRLPVVGGPITADTLSNRYKKGRFPGLVKITPDNLEQAMAIKKEHGVKPETAFRMVDTAAKDIYARDLIAAYEKVTKGTPYPPEEFDGGNADEGDFTRMVTELCGARTEGAKPVAADTVFFAGRPRQLSYLLNALIGRTCSERHITVISVSGASTLTSVEGAIKWEELQRANVAVEYTTVAHKNAWKDGAGRKPPPYGGSPRDFDNLEKLVDGRVKTENIGPTSLDDGRTITIYDSALTAIEGIRTTGEEIPSADEVRDAWKRLHGKHPVPGASGWICLDNDGLPINKAIVVARLDLEERGIRFKKLVWPAGAPKEECRGRAD